MELPVINTAEPEAVGEKMHDSSPHIQGLLMSGSLARATAQIEFVGKSEDLYRRRTDGANEPLMRRPCNRTAGADVTRNEGAG